MELFLFIELKTINLGAIIGVIGGTIGAIAGGWTIYDRFKNRKPNIKVLAPYQWEANNQPSNEKVLFVYFRFSNLSQSPTYIFLETLFAELYNPTNKKWEKIIRTQEPKEKPVTDFSEHEKNLFGINRAKFLNVFDDCSIKYGEPLCGYLNFFSETEKYTKLRIKVLDSRHKLLQFEIDFGKQKKHDPNS